MISCRNLKLWHQKQSVLAGVGYGCAYTPPIQALIEWFPDKRGLASGVVIAGFGSGALFFTPAMNSLMQKVSAIYMITYNNVNSVIANQIYIITITISLCNIGQFAVMPQYLGNSIQTVTEGGKLFTQIGDKLTEVVYATNAELAKLPYDLAEGNYI